MDLINFTYLGPYPHPTDTPPARKQPAPQPQPPAKTEPDWNDLAYQRQWPDAIIAFLKTKPQQERDQWVVINSIASEARPFDRAELRENTKQVMASITTLTRGKLLRRRTRRWIRLDPDFFSQFSFWHRKT